MGEQVVQPRRPTLTSGAACSCLQVKNNPTEPLLILFSGDTFAQTYSLPCVDAGRTTSSALGFSQVGMGVRTGVGAPPPNPQNYAFAGKTSSSHFQGPDGLGQKGEDKPRRQPSVGGEWATTHDSSY